MGPAEIAESISGDGTVIVGAADAPFGSAGGAFAWDGFHGSRDIAKLLVEQGVDLGGWQLSIARGVSHDGLTIAGLGLNPEGNQQPWMARFDPGTFIAEPSSIVLATVAFLFMTAAASRWRQSFLRLP